MITERNEKRMLVVTLGAHEAPAQFHWEAMRFLTNEDGSDATPPHMVKLPATPEEVQAHIGDAMAKVLQDVRADGERYSALLTKHNAMREKIREILQVAGEAIA